MQAAVAHVGREGGGRGLVHGFVADLSDQEAVRQLAADVRREHGQISCLINNAGGGCTEAGAPLAMLRCCYAAQVLPAVPLGCVAGLAPGLPRPARPPPPRPCFRHGNGPAQPRQPHSSAASGDSRAQLAHAQPNHTLTLPHKHP